MPDANTGRFYYHNKRTGETTWEKPWEWNDALCPVVLPATPGAKIQAARMTTSRMRNMKTLATSSSAVVAFRFEEEKEAGPNPIRNVHAHGQGGALRWRLLLCDGKRVRGLRIPLCQLREAMVGRMTKRGRRTEGTRTRALFSFSFYFIIFYVVIFLTRL